MDVGSTHPNWRRLPQQLSFIQQPQLPNLQFPTGNDVNRNAASSSVPTPRHDHDLEPTRYQHQKPAPPLLSRPNPTPFKANYPQVGQTPPLRKKPQRAILACNTCRRLKIRCSAEKPTCDSCKEAQVPCAYLDPVERQVDTKIRVSENKINQLDRMEQKLDELLALAKSPLTINEEIHDDAPSSSTSSQSSATAIPSEQDQRPPSMPRHAIGTTKLLHVEAIADMCRDIGSDIDILECPSLLEEKGGLLFEDDDSTAGDTYADEMPDFSRKTVDGLVESYKTHMNIIHPILVPSQLHALVLRFPVFDSQAEPPQASLFSQAPEYDSGCQTRGMKRKWRDHFSACEPGRRLRSIASAIVLLVMALGEICQNRRNIAGVIPGLAYLRIATNILGSQHAGTSLQHIQANLLAGLYYDQLGRVMESYAYIATACRNVQIILQPNLDRFKKIKADNATIPAGDNPLVFAFWACLQLESNIIAELPYPSSGILAHEENMPRPNMKASGCEGLDDMVIKSYTAQLFLRMSLNRLNEMFKPDAVLPLVLASTDPRKLQEFDIIEKCLRKILEGLPFINEDADKGKYAKDILSAQLRAKYYGVEVVAYRPFILGILGCSAGIKVEEIHQGVLRYARNGIKALVNSAKAFHGLGDPKTKSSIITNVWGTAHAQWGNIMTLQAIYRDPILHHLLLEIIDESGLKCLFQNMISFLSLIGARSPALNHDLEILIRTGRKIGLHSAS